MGRRHRLAGALGVVLTLLAASAGAQPVYADEHEPVKIRIEVTDSGFNGHPEGFTVEVEQGRLVEMTFVFAHLGYVNEEHVMVMPEYKLEWDKISFHNREATLRFIADKAGTFEFKCDNDCEVHDYLQRGQLKIKRGGGGGAASFTPTILTLSPSSLVTTGEALSLMAVLQDPKGAPVPKAEVHFSVDADFAGTKGAVNLGSAKTDANGVAFLDYQPTMEISQHSITARFDGMGVYDESSQVIEIQGVGAPAPAYTTAHAGLEPFWHWGPRVLWGVTLGVWGILAFIVARVLGITWAGFRGGGIINRRT